MFRFHGVNSHFTRVRSSKSWSPQLEMGKNNVHYNKVALTILSGLVLDRPSFSGSVLGYPSYLAYPRIHGMDHEVSVRFNLILTDDILSRRSGLILFTGQTGGKCCL